MTHWHEQQKLCIEIQQKTKNHANQIINYDTKKNIKYKNYTKLCMHVSELAISKANR